MRLTRFTHSCVRLEVDGRVLVIDPGIWSEPRALDGADAVLVTHEHVDHVDVLRLRGAQLPVFAHRSPPPSSRTTASRKAAEMLTRQTADQPSRSRVTAARLNTPATLGVDGMSCCQLVQSRTGDAASSATR